MSEQLLGFTQTEVETLIQGLQTTNPRLYQAIQLLNTQVQDIARVLSPLIIQSSSTATGTIAILDAPLNFAAASTGVSIRLSWTEVTGALYYEVRKGSSWATASFQFRITGLQADIDPLVYGAHEYLIKSINASGVYSLTANSVIFNVTQIPGVSISSQVIDNNVLLSWTAPASVFNIAYYKLYKDGALTGTVSSTFAMFFEVVSDTYVYSIIPVDIVGNEGTESTISVFVNTPPDFELQDSRVSALTGTLDDVLLLAGPKLLCCWEAGDFQDHFTDRTWLDPQDQIDDGYPIYIQPSSTTGSYEEIIDYGILISNVVCSVVWNVTIITPAASVAVLVRMATSTDGVTYTAFTNGASQFFSSLRYLKLRLEFTGDDDTALIELYNLTINLDVKREMDSGEISALSTDATGTVVLFNKAFKDIDSITCTVKSTKEPFRVIYSFVDAPNPTQFLVFAFDTTGNRVTATVSWKARGIV